MCLCNSSAPFCLVLSYCVLFFSAPRPYYNFSDEYRGYNNVNIFPWKKGTGSFVVFLSITSMSDVLKLSLSNLLFLIGQSSLHFWHILSTIIVKRENEWKVQQCQSYTWRISCFSHSLLDWWSKTCSVHICTIWIYLLFNACPRGLIWTLTVL